MKKRAVSFVALWGGLLLALVVFRIHAGVALVALCAALTQYELYRMFERMDLRPVYGLGIAGGLITVFGAYYLPSFDGAPNPDAGNDLFLFSFLLLTLTIIGRDLARGQMRSFLPTLFGLLYVPFLLHFLIKTVRIAEIAGHGTVAGMVLAVWAVAVAKCSDVGGLLVGMRFGRTRLAPSLSPKKTYEGALGGVLAAALVGAGLAAALAGAFPATFAWWKALLIAVPVAVAAIASDLVESAFKRQAEVKDSGTLIPGIGGAFDLIDSLILSAPTAYLFFKYAVL